jgi:hypothetical protein
VLHVKNREGVSWAIAGLCVKTEKGRKEGTGWAGVSVSAQIRLENRKAYFSRSFINLKLF